MVYESPILVAPRDIAELSGVSPAAVSNWSRRMLGFPKPEGESAGGPLYDWRKIQRWLAERPSTSDVARVRDGEVALIGVYNGLRESVDPKVLEAVVPAVAAVWRAGSDAAVLRSSADLVELLHGDGSADSAWALAAEGGAVDALGVVSDALHQGVVDEQGVTDLALAVTGILRQELGSQIDGILKRVAAAQGRSGESFGYVDSPVSRLLGELGASRAAQVIYDPTAGIGAGAIAAWTSAPEGQRPQRVVLHDIEPDALRIAEQRAGLWGVPVSTATGNILEADPEPDLAADVVICETPFGVSFDGSPADPRWNGVVLQKGSADLAWLAHAIAHLAPGGRAYIVTAMPALFHGSDASGRATLVERGSVEAIVSLPPKMLRYTSADLALWVLCRPGESVRPGEVLVLDASAQDSAGLDVVHWLEGRGDVPSRMVAIVDIIRGCADLNPARWITASAVAVYRTGLAAIPQRAAGNDLDRARADLASETQATARAIQELILTLDVPEIAMHTVSGLVDWGVLAVKRRGFTQDAVEVRDGNEISEDYLKLMLDGPWNSHVWAAKTKGPSVWDRVEIPMVPRAVQDEILTSYERIVAIQQGIRGAAEAAAVLGSTYLGVLRYGHGDDATANDAD